MGRKRAQIVTKNAFIQAFVEAEVVMRKQLHQQLEIEIEKHADEKIVEGLRIAQSIVYGTAHESE